LIIADGETMELVKTFDLDPTELQMENTDEQIYNYANCMDTKVYVALEVSKDGKYLLVVGRGRFRIFDMETFLEVSGWGYTDPSAWKETMQVYVVHCCYFE